MPTKETKPQDIYAFIQQEEAAYGQQVTIIDGYEWNMKEHLRISTLYKNGLFSTGKDENKPFKNITRPMLNLQKRAEDIDKKDVKLYVDDSDNYHLSFLVKKYHDDVFTQKHNIDELFDDAIESKVDYGGALLVKGANGMPEVRPLHSIAFCDQTNLLSGPMAFKDYFSPSELKAMEDNHWGDSSFGATITIDELVELADTAKDPVSSTAPSVRTPGKYVEVYVVRGSLPKRFYTDDEDSKGYMDQFHVVAFYRGNNDKKIGVTLFKSKKPQEMKLLIRDKMYNRALGLGGAEELVEPQVWTNYDIIRIKDMLDAASKVILTSDDETLKAKHPTGLKNIENMEVVYRTPGTTIGQVDTFPRNLALFERSVAEWENHAKEISGATDALLGQNPTSGTPFKLQDLVVRQGEGLHAKRRGKNAVFFQEVYRDWIIPQMVKEMTQGVEWLSELSLDEMQYIADCLVRNKAKEFLDEKVLSGQPIDPQEVELYKQKVRDEFVQGGNEQFLKLLKDEIKGLPIAVKVDIADKDDLSQMVDKLSNVMRFAFSTYNPQTGKFAIFDDPRMAKLFNEILEYSGLSPVDFYQQPKEQPQQPPQQLPQQQLQQLPQGQQLPPQLAALAQGQPQLANA